MPHSDQKSIDDLIRLSFLNASYGSVRNSLVRYTADFVDNVLHVQMLVEDCATADEIDDFMSISTQILAAFYDADLDEDIIKMSKIDVSRPPLELPIKLFCKAGASGARVMDDGMSPIRSAR